MVININYIFNCSNNKNKTNSICFTNHTDPYLIEMCSDVANKCNVLHRYRSYNGSCNNLKNPSTFGVAYRQFRRAIRPDYADGKRTLLLHIFDIKSISFQA